jgi:succinyl-diaminopimelate desuccinylase
VTHDPVPLAKALMRCASVTPRDAGAFDVLAGALEPLGFAVRRMTFGDVDNLFATRGARGPHLCLAGHTDVVPPGDLAAWSVDPFAAEERDGWLIGRGAADMKAAIAAMVCAAAEAPRDDIRLSFLITGDEEGPGIDGTKRALGVLESEGVRFDHCLIGEPTSETHVGDVVKNGRRGSVNAVIAVEGRQGHVAYPEQHNNPVAALLDMLAALRARRLDDGAPGFDPSNLVVTSVDVGNSAHNVVPARADAKLNIRFNTAHRGGDLKSWIEASVADIAQKRGVGAEARVAVTGEPFLTPSGPFTDFVCGCVTDAVARAPKLSTSGGTSDARFIKDHCPVVELGLQNATAHMVDEKVRVDDVRALARVYAAILARYQG